MQDEPLNLAALTAVTVAAALSLFTGFYLFQRHIGGQPLLEYEPRRRVPWGPLVVVIPLFFVGINLSPMLAGQEGAIEAEPDIDEFVFGGLVTSLLLIAFVGIAMAWLIGEGKADLQDLGLPTNRTQVYKDVKAGAVGCLFALLPIYVLNVALMFTFNSEQQHPLIEHLVQERSPMLMAVGLLSAVVAAPLFEEFTFRVLLQGWLEKAEDERVNYTATQRRPVETVTDENGVFDAGVPAANNSRALDGWIPGLPHGWAPIIISAIVFGVAHIGHGVAPIPLVLLGLVFGYLYQRTHRLTAPIVAHALFNSCSLLLLWLQMSQG